MRPTDSSLRTPAWLSGLAGVAALAAIVLAQLPREVPLYRFQTFGQQMMSGYAPGDPGNPDDYMSWDPRGLPGLRPMGRPMLVAFTDDGPESARLSHDVFEDAYCANRIGRVFVCIRAIVPGAAHGGPDPALAQVMDHWQVRTLPTLLFLDPRGNVVERMDRFPGRGALMHTVVRWQDRYPPGMHYQD